VREDENILLIDARAPERYRGETEPIDAKPGHIPGAKNLPFIQNFDSETGKFLDVQQLTDKYKSLGASEVKKIICYCGSGVTACTDILALKLLGLESQLYEGSWSDWSRDGGLPIASSPSP